MLGDTRSSHSSHSSRSSPTDEAALSDWDSSEGDPFLGPEDYAGWDSEDEEDEEDPLDLTGFIPLIGGKDYGGVGDLGRAWARAQWDSKLIFLVAFLFLTAMFYGGVWLIIRGATNYGSACDRPLAPFLLLLGLLMMTMASFAFVRAGHSLSGVTLFITVLLGLSFVGWLALGTWWVLKTKQANCDPNLLEVTEHTLYAMYVKVAVVFVVVLVFQRADCSHRHGAQEERERKFPSGTPAAPRKNGNPFGDSAAESDDEPWGGIEEQIRWEREQSRSKSNRDQFHA